MKETFYFQHDYEPTSDPKIQALLGAWWWMWYWIYWRIVEMLHSNQDHELPLKPYIFQAIASQMLWSSTEIEAMIKSMISDYELFESQWEIFWSQRVKNNIAKMEEIREKRKKAGSKWGIARMEKVASAKQKVAKSSKIKENRIKETDTSSIEEVIFIPEFSANFQLKYKEWIDDRKVRKKPVTEKAMEIQLWKLKSWWEEKAIIAIDTAIAAWYQWLFEPKSWWFQKPEKKSLTQIAAENPDFF